MSKLKRDVSVWAKRIRMSKTRLWAIVEGKNFDTPFYEGLLHDGGGISATLLECEDIEVDGVAAGGKNHGLKIIDRLASLGALEQQNNSTKIDVVFFADRDDDDYTSSMSSNSHVAYTQHADVESEIVAWSNLALTTAHAFSIPREEATAATNEDYHATLGDIWLEWITLRLSSAAVGWSDTRFSHESQVNDPKYGPIDQLRVNKLCARVAGARSGWANELNRARQQMQQEQATSIHRYRVKGKWLAPFIVARVSDSLSAQRVPVRVHPTTYMASCLTHVDFDKCWNATYRPRLEPLLSR